MTLQHVSLVKVPFPPPNTLISVSLLWAYTGDNSYLKYTKNHHYEWYVVIVSICSTFFIFLFWNTFWGELPLSHSLWVSTCCQFLSLPQDISEHVAKTQTITVFHPSAGMSINNPTCSAQSCFPKVLLNASREKIPFHLW